MDLKSKIREIEDFPKKGVSFKDITTLLKDGEVFKYLIEKLSDQLRNLDIDIIVAPEARGFLIGAPIAYNLGIGFVPIRKSGKLPAETINCEYELEYGTDLLEIHKDAIKPGQRVAILDDLLATGGTVLASAKLVERLGGEVVTINFIIGLDYLDRENVLKDYKTNTLIQYEE
ncbi:MAG TPA: adenine phosphoribosyltransferase [Clostridia bacterium]|nr:adenine phosphoribosyltransferase [Clostridiales bacterium]HZK57405.1 adenine phosphoribosyltransferase [Clostridia bacterium]